MTGVWLRREEKWEPISSDGFPDEDTLQRLIADAPHLLPLAGAPQVSLVGREVRIGPGSLDILLIEHSGSLAVVEVKLERNPEARRAVVSQVLSYAAHFQGLTVEELETTALERHLRERGHGSLLDLAQSEDQRGEIDPDSFKEQLASSLSDGSFRIVLVLDDTPEELVRLTAYLEMIAPRVQIDLVKISAYTVGGEQVVIPQRVDPGRSSDPVTSQVVQRPARPPKGELFDGGDLFAESIDEARPESREMLTKLYTWAKGLEDEGLVKLNTFKGISGRLTLLPRLQPEDVGLATVWNDAGHGSVSLWRSVFDRVAPGYAEQVEAMIAPAKVGQGTGVPQEHITDELLALLKNAYRAGATG